MITTRIAFVLPGPLRPKVQKRLVSRALNKPSAVIMPGLWKSCWNLKLGLLITEAGSLWLYFACAYAPHR